MNNILVHAKPVQIYTPFWENGPLHLSSEAPTTVHRRSAGGVIRRCRAAACTAAESRSPVTGTLHRTFGLDYTDDWMRSLELRFRSAHPACGMPGRLPRGRRDALHAQKATRRAATRQYALPCAATRASNDRWTLQRRVASRRCGICR